MAFFKKKKWGIILEGEKLGKEADEKLKVADFSGFGVKVGFDFITDLLGEIEKQENYEEIKCIKEVKSPKKEDFFSKTMFLIMATYKRDNTQVGTLFNLVDSENLLISGLWPDRFYNVCKEQATTGNNKLLLGMLDSIIVNTEEWKEVKLYTIPSSPSK